MNIRNLAGSTGARVVVALVIMMTCSFAVFGQQTTGSIVGTVTDPQGAVVNTATVRATNLDTGFSRVGAGERLWRVPHRLPSGGQLH